MTFGQGRANFATSSEAVAQNVRTRLLLIQEEWFLDIAAGVPYLGKIAVKPADLPLAEALLKRRILETEGVEEILSFSLQLDRETRKLQVSASVATIYGTTENIKVVS